MAEVSAYNTETMRLLMTAALNVEFSETTGDENEVTCASKGVTAPCSEAGADQLMELAYQRQSAAEVAYGNAIAAKDAVDIATNNARGIRDQMRAAAEAGAVAGGAGARS